MISINFGVVAAGAGSVKIDKIIHSALHWLRHVKKKPWERIAINWINVSNMVVHIEYVTMMRRLLMLLACFCSAAGA